MAQAAALLMMGGMTACDPAVGAPDGALADESALSVDGAASPPVTVVDSIHPIEEEIRRFKVALGDSATSLQGGAASRDELVEGFLAALSTRDTASLNDAHLTQAEFIDLYFPHTAYMRPPYQMDPAFIWFQMVNQTSQGITRALNRFGGAPLSAGGYQCGREFDEGPNRLYDLCTVRIGSGADTLDLRLFGMIIERDGHFKFVTYGNSL